MKFLNGWKTILGVVGTVTTLGIASGGHVADLATKAAEVAQHADSIAMGAFGLLTVLGIVHKVEKRQT